MKRSLFAFSAASAALLVCGIARAQVPAGNMNDLPFNNGGDFFYIYNNPGIGSPVGVSGIPDFLTNDYIWRTIPGGALKSCKSALVGVGVTPVPAMELTGIHFDFDCDGDYTAVDTAGNNTAFPDVYYSRAAATQSIAGVFDPDQADVDALFVSFGPDTGKGNLAVPDPGCPPPGYINCYDIEADLTNGAGVGFGVNVHADGVANLVQTTFLPGGMTSSGANTCADNNGDGILADFHSGNAGGQIPTITTVETQFDDIGGNTSSHWGGFGSLGATLGSDNVNEIQDLVPEFSQPVVNMYVNSHQTGAGFLEEGDAGYHYNAPPEVGGTVAARLYAGQGVGRPAAVFMTLSPALPACVKFKGDKIWLNGADPIFGVTASLWTGTVLNTNNGGAVAPLDDGTLTTLSLPLPAQVVPVGFTVPLAVQGFYKKTTGLVEGSQCNQWIIHG